MTRGSFEFKLSLLIELRFELFEFIYENVFFITSY